MSATPRSGLLEWRCSRFEGLDIPPGFCSWCGERIWLVNPQDYRRARRTRHYGELVFV